VTATDWGNVPAWIALVGGLSALVSYATARVDARRVVASGLYVVPTRYKYGDPPSDENRSDHKIANAGSLPVYDVGVSVWEFGRRRWFWRFRLATDWMSGKRLEGRVFPAIEPGGTVDVEDMTPPQRPTEPTDSRRPPILLIFRDGNGRKWVRWPDGRLNRARVVRFETRRQRRDRRKAK
jgi:hypothetical protein